MVKNLPAVLVDPSSILGSKDPLEKEMATKSSILAWEIPRTEEPGGLQSTGWQRITHNRATNTHNTVFFALFSFTCTNHFPFSPADLFY